MSRTSWQDVALTASYLGATGRTCLRLLAEHRVLELPMIYGCLGLHYSTVREAMGRLQARGLVTVRRSQRDPTQPSRWFLTERGALTAKMLHPDPSVQVRVTAEGRPEHATRHDLALAHLRLTIYRRHWPEIIVQRGRPYIRNGPAVDADREFRDLLATGGRVLISKEPEVRLLERRRLRLPLAAEIPVEPAVLIPDLFWPGGDDTPSVIIEYEGRRTESRTVREKAVHLAGYCYGQPAAVIVVYPAQRDAKVMASVWRKVVQSLPSSTPLAVTVTSMEALVEARVNAPGGLDLEQPVPQGILVSAPSDGR